MAWIGAGIGVAIGIWIVLATYVFAGVKKTYDENGMFTNKLLTFWLVMWGFYHLALILSSWYGVWPLPMNKTVALVGGLVLIVAGVTMLAAGMREFRSLRRSCGQDVSELITTGVYRWSRNPQFIGCLLYLLGISLAGRSLFAFALTGAAALLISWYTVRLAEPYLERLYGREYQVYRSGTARWFGAPRSIKRTETGSRRR